MLTLRPTTEADLPSVTAWEAERDTGRWLGDTGPSWHRRALADPAQEHLIAVEDVVENVAEEIAGGTRVVGFAVLAGLRDPEVELRRMVVAPGHRGAGRGRALLRAVLARATGRHRATEVWLDVKASNARARALYESEGFAVTRTLGELVYMSRQNGSGIQRWDSFGGRS
jgi:diamine N-acetyltransferase